MSAILVAGVRLCDAYTVASREVDATWLDPHTLEAVLAKSTEQFHYLFGRRVLNGLKAEATAIGLEVYSPCPTEPDAHHVIGVKAAGVDAATPLSMFNADYLASVVNAMKLKLHALGHRGQPELFLILCEKG